MKWSSTSIHWYCIALLYALTKHSVLAVQVGCGHGGDEELTAVGVGARVGHREETRLGVLLDEVLVREFVTYRTQTNHT